ncbi:MAG: DUF3185 family protein [Halobacteriales archaeon]
MNDVRPNLASASIGAVLLIAGVVVALYAHQEIQEFETAFGQIGRALSSEAESEYQVLSVLRIGGAVSAVVGLVLVLRDR